MNFPWKSVLAPLSVLSWQCVSLSTSGRPPDQLLPPRASCTVSSLPLQSAREAPDTLPRLPAQTAVWRVCLWPGVWTDQHTRPGWAGRGSWLTSWPGWRRLQGVDGSWGDHAGSWGWLRPGPGTDALERSTLPSGNALSVLCNQIWLKVNTLGSSCRRLEVEDQQATENGLRSCLHVSTFVCLFLKDLSRFKTLNENKMVS